MERRSGDSLDLRKEKGCTPRTLAMNSQHDVTPVVDMHPIHLNATMDLDALVAELRTCNARSKQPLLLILPAQPTQAFRRSDDFRVLKMLQQKLATPILFVIPNSRHRGWARSHDLVAFESQEALQEKLNQNLPLSSGFTPQTEGVDMRESAQKDSGVLHETTGKPEPQTESLLAAGRMVNADNDQPGDVCGPESRQHVDTRANGERESLEAVLQRRQAPMHEKSVLVYAAQILEILTILEQQSPPIVHGAIKPSNIILEKKHHRVHLIGLSQSALGGAEDGIQHAGIDTPGYTAPEQLQGMSDPRSDLYALAATMHHLLTNRHPDSSSADYHYPLVRLVNPHVSAETERLLARALTYDIELRYQHAYEMKRDIDELVAKQRNTTHEPERGGPPPPPLATPGTLDVPAPFPKGEQHSPATHPPLYHPSLPQPLIPPNQNDLRRISSPHGTDRKRTAWQVGVTLLCILILGGGLLSYLSSARMAPHLPAASSSQCRGMCVQKTDDHKEIIGLSDGYAFDTESDRLDRQDMQAANAAFQHGNIPGAIILWNTAQQEDTSDPQPKIFLENQRVLNSTLPYMDLVVATMESGTYVSLGRWDLQGAYVAQREYNSACKLPGCTQVRLLVASSGNQATNAIPVANQIVDAARQPGSHILGVMGWPYSSRVLNVVRIFSQARIPLLSQMASSTALSGISPYFWRTVPNDSVQAQVGATYVETHLHAKTAALFFDKNDAYSNSVGEAFKLKFAGDGNQILGEYPFTAGNSRDQIAKGLQIMIKRGVVPDIIDFGGVATDASHLLEMLPQSGPFSHVTVWGGDGLYEVGAYTGAARANYHRLRFTAFAFPDTWVNLGLQRQEPPFFAEYPAAFDPFHRHFGGAYGFRRADGDCILSYDATMVLMEAYSLATQQSHGQVRPADMRRALSEINGPRTIQGATGQIALGANGDATNKAVVVLEVSPQNTLSEAAVVGQFLKR